MPKKEFLFNVKNTKNTYIPYKIQISLHFFSQKLAYVCK